MGNDLIQQKILFSKEECEYLKTLFNDDDFKRSQVLRNNGKTHYSDLRTSEELFLNFKSDYKNILTTKLKNVGIVSTPPFFSILRYNVGQQFKKHRDNDGERSKSFDKRYKSVVIQLSDKNDYEGGRLIIYENDREIVTTNEIGSVIVFNSTLVHEVTKLTSGKRYSIVFWTEKENFALKHDLI